MQHRSYGRLGGDLREIPNSVSKFPNTAKFYRLYRDLSFPCFPINQSHYRGFDSATELGRRERIEFDGSRRRAESLLKRCGSAVRFLDGLRGKAKRCDVGGVDR